MSATDRSASGRRRTSFPGGQWYFRLFYKIGWLVAVPITRLLTRMTIAGGEHIPKRGPFILAPVHRSYVDTPIIAGVTFRRMRYMGKDSMWKYERLGKVFSALGAFPVHRGSIDREAIQRAFESLEIGDGLVLFPEGERKQGPTVFPLLDGAIFVAVKAGVPIIPVGIGGSERVMPKGAKFIHPHKVHVEIGEPIMPPTNERGRVPRAAYAETSQRLHDELQRLFDRAMAQVGWSYPQPGAEPDASTIHSGKAEAS